MKTATTTTTIALEASNFIHREERESHRPTVTCLLPLKTLYSRMSHDLPHNGKFVLVCVVRVRVPNEERIAVD